MVICDINGKSNEFFLGSHEIFEGTKYEQEIEDGDFSVYSPDSPIGQAIEGKKVGERVSYSAPNGKEIVVEIKQIQNFKF
jgi:transcription elongation factor GreA